MHTRGKLGELYAAHYLLSRGYHLLHRNYYTRIGEIDLIAMDSDVLVFVEVKTRSSTYFDAVGTSVPVWKCRRMVRVAHLYCSHHHYFGDIRFDVIHCTVDRDNMLQSLCHIDGIR